VEHARSVAAYVENQEEHHRKLTFQEEFRAFLKKHRVVFDEQYLWDRHAPRSAGLSDSVAVRQGTQG
jgi:hypothetical protein